MPRLMEPDPPLPEIITYAAALAVGLTRDQVRHRVRSGRWVRIGSGLFVHNSRMPAASDRFARRMRAHVDRANAAAARYPGAVIGFQSAVATHGLPLWTPLPERPSIIMPPGQAAGVRSIARLRHVWLAEHHVSRWAQVTTPARSWLDVARTCGLADALCVGDAGVREGIFTADDLETIADECAALIGMRKVQRALSHICRLRESPLESGSWAYFVENHVPLPSMQVTIRDDRSRFVARVDFLWDGVRVVGECDGLVKYRSPEDLMSEKRREDRLRALGYRVIRWGASDLAGPRLARQIRDVLGNRV